MGYDAYVRCNCYKEGKTVPPPYEEHVKEDLEFYYLDLYWKTHKKENEAFSNWIQNACPHEDMEICSERLANISGMSQFRSLIKDRGEKNYPTLKEHLPQSNGGHLEVDLAYKMKEELLRLSDEETLIESYNLIEESSKRIISSTRLNKKFTFGFGKKNVFSISREAFQIHHFTDIFGIKIKELEFSSTLFTVTKIEEKKYLYEDAISKKRFICDFSIIPDGNQEHYSFKVKKGKLPIKKEYSYIIEPLLKLLEASIETQNPIIWT